MAYKPPVPDVPESVKPKFLDEEQMHNKYSVEATMKEYGDKVYYRQRRGGSGWFHGRVSKAYRNKFDGIFKLTKENQ